jgi:hypothetical protein
MRHVLSYLAQIFVHQYRCVFMSYSVGFCAPSVPIGEVRTVADPAHQNQAASENSSSLGADDSHTSGNSAFLSPNETAEQLWQLARICEAEKAKVRQQFEEEESKAMRQQVIQLQHKGRNYNKQELSERLWELVRASEKFSNRAQSVDDSAERPVMQQDAGEAQTDAGPQVYQESSSVQQGSMEKQRRKGVFEDIGVSQQAAWCGAFTAT